MKTIILLFFITTFTSCGQNQSVEKTINFEKEQYDNRSVEEISKTLEIQMLDYIEYNNNEYSKKDVEDCMVIINKFIKKISQSKSKKEGQNIVNETIIKLNKLNKKCHSGLIETEQRENICTIISKMQFQKGYILENEDTTLQLREW